MRGGSGRDDTGLGSVTFDGLPLVDLGATALVAIFVLAILAGRLVPRRALEDAERRTAEAKRDAEKWERVALEAWSDLRKLTVTAEASAAVLPAIPKIPHGDAADTESGDEA